MSQTYITLNNGTKIPQVGMGVFMVPEGEETKQACLNALNKEPQLFSGTPIVECAVCADIPNLSTIDCDDLL